MPIVKCQSGREYLLELNKLVLEEMAPSVTSVLSDEIMDKMAAYAKNQGKDNLDKVNQWQALREMGLTPEEFQLVKANMMDTDIGPETIKVCIRKVNGSEVFYRQIDNIWADHPGDGYKDWGDFVDRDETLIDDLPELMEPIQDKLTNFYGGISAKGELMPSSKNSKPQKKAEPTTASVE